MPTFSFSSPAAAVFITIFESSHISYISSSCPLLTFGNRRSGSPRRKINPNPFHDLLSARHSHIFPDQDYLFKSLSSLCSSPICTENPSFIANTGLTLIADNINVSSKHFWNSRACHQMSSTISSLLFISFSTNHHRHRRHQHFEAIRPRPIFWWQKPQEAGPGCPTNTRPNGHERDDDEGVNDCGDIEDFVAFYHTYTTP